MERGEKICITPIGVLSCGIRSREEAPKNYDESDLIGVITVFPEYQAAMDGIEPGQTITVLFWLHQARRDILRVHPRGDTSRPIRGVFATRSPVRPNPIAVSELLVLVVADTKITVQGLDILDGTPVLDIKKSVAWRVRVTE